MITPFDKKHDFFVGIDSDGCVFDSMELKHKECFIPNTINFYDLQGVSKYARECWEFVNLYSRTRGVNRFPALLETLRWLGKRPEVRARGVQVLIPQGLVRWVESETKLGNPALQAALQACGDPDLRQALAWSEAVNASVEAIVRNVPPFPSVRACLQQVAPQADLVVASATPVQALTREWHEHELAEHLAAIFGQEAGSKKDILASAQQYPVGQRLMIGDAPGDHRAAAANDLLFYPINPGDEEASWKRLLLEGIARFLQRDFAGSFQEQLLAEFYARLPQEPPFEVV